MPPTLHVVGPAESIDAGPAPIRVLIAEGQGLIRAGFRALLEGGEAMCVAAEAATGEEVVAAALELRPDVVVIDGGLPGLDALEATRRILADSAPGRTGVLILLADGSDEVVFDALRAGATGLLLRDGGADALVQGVRVVAEGETALAPRLARRLVEDFLARPDRLRSTPEKLAELTAREREVVALVGHGLSNDEIAEQLVVARATAKTHVSRAMCKLDARDRAQLVVLAYESGLVRPPDASAALHFGSHRLAA
jgi:DNA-binding NarL/FixJ family response regulator